MYFKGMQCVALGCCKGSTRTSRNGSKVARPEFVALGLPMWSKPCAKWLSKRLESRAVLKRKIREYCEDILELQEGGQRVTSEITKGLREKWLRLYSILKTISDGEKAAAALKEEEEMVQLARQTTAEQDKQRNMRQLHAACTLNEDHPAVAASLLAAAEALRTGAPMPAAQAMMPSGGHEATYREVVIKAFMAAPGAKGTF